jgi:hypothetical protein
MWGYCLILNLNLSLWLIQSDIELVSLDLKYYLTFSLPNPLPPPEHFWGVELDTDGWKVFMFLDNLFALLQRISITENYDLASICWNCARIMHKSA